MKKLLPRGVSLSGLKYTSCVTHKGLRYYLGTFNTVYEAVEAYTNKKAELNTEDPKVKITVPISEYFKYFDGFLYNKATGTKYANTNNSGYVLAYKDGRALLAHRVIWELLNGNIPKGLVIDHIDGNKSNNLIENLRLATHQENLANASGKSKKGLPKGVTLKASGKYSARIQYNYKNYYLGVYSTIEEAKAVYYAKAVELFGEYARA